MTDSFLIKGGLVLDPANNLEETTDIRISGGQIMEKGANLSRRNGEEVLDAKGLWVCPGLIDLHCHLRDLGQKEKEDLETGTMAAAAGGFTTVVAMANTEPTVDNVATLNILKERIEQKAWVEVLPVAAVTKGLKGVELTNMVELSEAGAVAFSDDGMPVSNMAVLRRALEYARLAERVIISHSEDRDLSGKGVIHEGVKSVTLGLQGIPAAAETVAIAREIEMVRQTDVPYHFTHVSCAASVELIRRAKHDGLPITADVTPHHLTLSVNQIPGFNTNYKMRPPLRLEEDQAAIMSGIKDGTIDAIATDHAPHTRLDKACPMDEAAVGVIGLETAFSLAYGKLVREGNMNRLDFIGLFTRNPANVLDLDLPSLQPGAPANLAIIDPQRQWTYDVSKGYSRSHNSPFNGLTLTGKNVMTIFLGKPIYKDDDALAGKIKGDTHGKSL